MAPTQSTLRRMSGILGRRSCNFIGEVLGYPCIFRRFLSCTRRAVDLAAKDGELRVFLVSGELSGDTIGARLMAALGKISPFPVKFSGVGGPMMSQRGLQSLFPMEDLAVMGIWELLPHLNTIKTRLRETVKAAVLFRPHVVVTVDSKGFSFRFLKKLRASSSQHLMSPLHFHYVAPSFWAWKGGEARLKGLSQFVDHIFCILPFEAEVCRSNGLAATFVGHPVLEDYLEEKDSIDWTIQKNSEDSRKRFEIPPGAQVITLLPGSRLQEVARMLPIFLETTELLKSSLPDLRTIMVVACNQHVESYISKMLYRWPVSMTLISGSSTSLKYDAFSASTAALCTSGTVAVELQFARLPCVVAYRAHIFTELYIRLKARVQYISLPNILLDSCVIPEALFGSCTPRTLTSSLMELIQDDDLKELQMKSAEKVFRLLRPSVNGFVQNEWRDTSQPSMIAASTLLYYEAPRISNPYPEATL